MFILFADADLTLDYFETIKRRNPDAYPLLYTDLIIDFLFMIDILMNFRTTYVKEGEMLITNPWKIAVHYLKTYFVVDLVAAIPWDLLASFNSGTEEVSSSRSQCNFSYFCLNLGKTPRIYVMLISGNSKTFIKIGRSRYSPYCLL